MNKLLSPKNDIVFQKLFGKNENKDILISFLNSILGDNQIIKDVQIKEKKISVSTILDEKISILDIYVITDNGININVEMQIVNEYNIIKRTLYYWSKMYLNQINKGDDYSFLNRTITINLIDFNFIKNKKFHNVYSLLENETKQPLTDVLEINFIELRKFRDSMKDKDNKLHHWLSFIENPNGEDVSDMSIIDDDIRNAKDILSSISADEETRELAEMREKAIRDKMSQINGAKREAMKEGFQQGLERGIEQEKVEIAKKLLDILDDETIAIKTGLDIKYIKDLRKL